MVGSAGMSRDPAASSPIDASAFVALGARIRKAWRLVGRRAPAEIRARVEAALDSLEGGGPEGLPARITFARELEALDAELHGRIAFVPQFYRDGRLGVVHFFDPVRIVDTVDPRRIEEHFRRYEERLERSEMRLHWLYERAGLEVDPPRKLRPWELPYANLEEVRELLWGRVRRGVTPPR